jgi:hypothetical protein
MLLAVLCMGCASRCTGSTGSTGSTPSCLTRAIQLLDIYSLAHTLKQGESPVRRATTLGGCFTLLAFSLIATFTTYMVVQWVENNTLLQRSLETVTPDVWQETAGLPWVHETPRALSSSSSSSSSSAGGSSSSSAAASASASSAAASSSSLVLRITVDGEPGACGAPLAWSGGGLLQGAWELRSVADCGGSGIAQHTLTCPRCALSASTALSLTFHYSCQSYLLEGSSLLPYPYDATSYAAAPPRLTAPHPGGGELLTAFTWRLTPVLSLLWDNVTSTAGMARYAAGVLGSKPSRSALGWRLADSTVVAGPGLRPGVAGTNASALALQPLGSAVQVTIELPLSNTYATTLLTPRVPLAQLISNIVGLAGLLSLFGVAFSNFERCTQQREQRGPGGGGSPSSPAPAGGGSAGLECTPGPASGKAPKLGAFSITNPLLRSRRQPSTAAAAAATTTTSSSSMHHPPTPPAAQPCAVAQGGEDGSACATREPVAWEAFQAHPSPSSAAERAATPCSAIEKLQDSAGSPGRGSQAPSSSSAPPVSYWYARQDGPFPYYENVDGTATEWDLPLGGAVVPDPEGGQMPGEAGERPEAHAAAPDHPPTDIASDSAGTRSASADAAVAGTAPESRSTTTAPASHTGRSARDVMDFPLSQQRLNSRVYNSLLTTLRPTGQN